MDNQQIWRNGIRNVDRRVEVILERKKNEEDDEAQEKFYTLVRLAK
jgi:ribosomal protein L31E